MLEGKVVSGRIETDKLRGSRRLAYAVKELEAVLDRCNPDLVVYEDYAMSRGTMGRVFHMGELGGVFKVAIWRRGVDLMVVDPMTLKMVITGRGNAGRGLKGLAAKEPMSKALRETFAIDVKQNDEADATGLLLIGEMKTGNRKMPENALKSKHAAAIAGCEVQRGQLQLIAKR